MESTASRGPDGSLEHLVWLLLGAVIGLVQVGIVVSGVVTHWLAASGAAPDAPFALAVHMALFVLGLMVLAVAWRRFGPLNFHASPEWVLRRLARESRGVREALYLTLALMCATLALSLLPSSVRPVDLGRALIAVIPGLLYLVLRQLRSISQIGEGYRQVLVAESQRRRGPV